MSTVLERVRSGREFSVDVGDGLAVRLRRPLHWDLQALHPLTPEKLARCAVGWSGFTEVQFLGAAVGASDPVPFDAALLAEWLGDRPEVFNDLGEALVKAVQAFEAQKDAAEKN